MMKKFLGLWIAAAAILTSSGCFAQEEDMVKFPVEPEKIIVVYYSWGGNTRYAAEKIHETSGGTLFEIKPLTPYPADYNDCVAQARKEVPAEFAPPLAAPLPDLADYDVIIVGSPNWCGTMAPPVRTFVNNSDLSGKTVIPFLTHGGGGMQNYQRDMNKLCRGAKMLPAEAFWGSSIKSADAELAAFVLDRLELKK